jgi:hypothetical protein
MQMRFCLVLFLIINSFVGHAQTTKYRYDQITVFKKTYYRFISEVDTILITKNITSTDAPRFLFIGKRTYGIQYDENRGNLFFDTSGKEFATSPDNEFWYITTTDENQAFRREYVGNDDLIYLAGETRVLKGVLEANSVDQITLTITEPTTKHLEFIKAIALAERINKIQYDKNVKRGITVTSIASAVTLFLRILTL